jgi:hypothetical protein
VLNHATNHKQNVGIYYGTHSKIKKVRIIGLVLLIVGISIQFTMENDMTDFISAAGIGAGFGLLVTGKVVKPSI